MTAGHSATALPVFGHSPSGSCNSSTACARSRIPEPELTRAPPKSSKKSKLDRTKPGFIAGEALSQSLCGAHRTRNRAHEQQVRYQTRRSSRSIEILHARKTRCPVDVGDFRLRRNARDRRERLWHWSGATGQRFSRPRNRGKPRGRAHIVHVPGAVRTQLLAGATRLLANIRTDQDSAYN